MTVQLAGQLAEIERQGLLRQRRMAQSPAGAVVRVEGRERINFCSNDYLGHASHPAVVDAFTRGAARWGVGAGASHLVCGHTLAHQSLEEELADFCGRERALLFSTGYMANLGVLGALAGTGDVIHADRLNHASLIDGARLSGARLRRYPHADTAALADRLSCPHAGRTLIVTDGVFSMDGDIAPLARLAALARTHPATLVVDDAHGFGVLGERGAGSLEAPSLGTTDVPVLIGTLGKALGTSGAFVAGDAELIRYLLQKARTFLYTTASPPALAEATRASLALLQSEPWRRTRLAAHITRFRAGAQSLGLPLSPSETPIQPLVLGENTRALAVSEWLWEQGLWVGAIRPPTVPEGTARLRVTLSAAHDDAQIDRLLDALGFCPELAS